MKKLQYGLQLLAFLSLLSSVTSLLTKHIQYIQIKAPNMKPRLSPRESQWANRFEAGLETYGLYSKGFATIQCLGIMAGASTVEGGVDRCDMSDPTPSVHIEKADIIFMPEQYRRSLNDFNKLALDNKIFPIVLESRLKQDPEALLAIINLPSEAGSAATKRFGRILAQENPGQKPLSKALKSTKKGKVLSFEADDEEGVGRIVGYIARKSFGKLLDFLDNDPYYGLHPDKDDIPKNLLSRTTERKQLPAIFKGDSPVNIIQANFYAAQKILHPSKDSKN
ncbi:uncharacterized protein NECHADRAFT_88086 [Fusarium vanettenii 77-13-4]|uniref:Uncharacterized protein n=1 Tax=Fusarium vanettenii (strain ATCC MYA-4622 / CBS 123669 / FGSC 9596 / NRRL 45880 / 77-13-4) TaxID=660122 RepID=C7ZL74_FUSV7|nr:uncharacterized protein NECHADRAFT_88086 [Fusarium vanettenii 77-13-4]EEU35240.1 predicted protein [Fusarium vanettenii 77-13-4]